MAVCGLSNGLVCVVDLRGSRVVRCVRFERAVTAVEVVAPGAGGDHRLLSEEVHTTLFCLKYGIYDVARFLKVHEIFFLKQRAFKNTKTFILTNFLY